MRSSKGELEDKISKALTQWEKEYRYQHENRGTHHRIYA